MPNTPPTNSSDWFKPSDPFVASTPVKRRAPRKLLVGGALLVVALVFGLFLTTMLTRSNVCLDTTDYKDLTGVPASNLNPKLDFYTYAIEFNGTSTTYFNDGSPSSQTIIKTVGDFYKSHSKKSIVVTIDSLNSTATTQATATERLQTLKKDLLAAGVGESSIKANTPAFIESESDAKDVATIALSSRTDCRK
jgi:hypothetical protein